MGSCKTGRYILKIWVLTIENNSSRDLIKENDILPFWVFSSMKKMTYECFSMKYDFEYFQKL